MKRFLLALVAIVIDISIKADAYLHSDFFVICDNSRDKWSDAVVKPTYFHVYEDEDGTYYKMDVSCNGTTSTYRLFDPYINRNDSGGGEHVIYTGYYNSSKCFVMFRLDDGSRQLIIGFNDYTFAYNIDKNY